VAADDARAAARDDGTMIVDEPTEEAHE